MPIVAPLGDTVSECVDATNLERHGDNDETLDDNGNGYPGRHELGTVAQVVAQLARQVGRVHEVQRQPTASTVTLI